MAEQRARVDSGLNEKPDDSSFGREVKRFARAREMASTADLKRAVRASSEAEVGRHLQVGPRRPQRETVRRYADALRVPQEYFLALVDYIDDRMVNDALATFSRTWEAARPLLRGAVADDLYRRITEQRGGIWGRVGAAVYLGAWRDRAELSCGLRDRERPALALLRDALTPLGFDLRPYTFKPTPDAMVFDFFFQLPNLIPEPFLEPTRTFVRGLYQQCGVDLAAFDRELAAYTRDPHAWLQRYVTTEENPT